MASRTIGTTMTAVSSPLVRLLSGLAIDVFGCSEALGVVVVRTNAVIVAMGVRVIVGTRASTIMLGGKVGVVWPSLWVYRISGRSVGFEEGMTGKSSAT